MHRYWKLVRHLKIFVYIVTMTIAMAGCGGSIDPSPGPGAGGDPVAQQLLSDIRFSDPKLAQCVTDTGKIYVSELTELICVAAGFPVRLNALDLDGIEKLTSLTRLELDLRESFFGSPALTLKLPESDSLEHLLISGISFLAGVDLDLSENTTLKTLSLNLHTLHSFVPPSADTITTLSLDGQLDVTPVLSALGLSGPTALTSLTIKRWNSGDTLDLSENTGLKNLAIQDAKGLLTLNLPPLNLLEDISIQQAWNLQDLDVKGSPNLKSLTFTRIGSRVPTLDLTNNKALTKLVLDGSDRLAWTGLDLSQNTALTELSLTYLEMSIPYLDLSEQTALTQFLYRHAGRFVSEIEFAVDAPLTNARIEGPIDTIYLSPRLIESNLFPGCFDGQYMCVEL
jgi:hypothetical protein